MSLRCYHRYLLSKVDLSLVMDINYNLYNTDKHQTCLQQAVAMMSEYGMLVQAKNFCALKFLIYFAMLWILLLMGRLLSQVNNTYESVKNCLLFQHGMMVK